MLSRREREAMHAQRLTVAAPEPVDARAGLAEHHAHPRLARGEHPLDVLFLRQRRGLERQPHPRAQLVVRHEQRRPRTGRGSRDLGGHGFQAG